VIIEVVAGQVVKPAPANCIRDAILIGAWPKPRWRERQHPLSRNAAALGQLAGARGVIVASRTLRPSSI